MSSFSSIHKIDPDCPPVKDFRAQNASARMPPTASAAKVALPQRLKPSQGPTLRNRCWLTSQSFVRLCYYVVVRTTLDISDEAYYVAKAIARDRNRSLGGVVGDLIPAIVERGERRIHRDERLRFPHFPLRPARDHRGRQGSR